MFLNLPEIVLTAAESMLTSGIQHWAVSTVGIQDKRAKRSISGT
jgi:hypothetical protein